MMLIAFAGMQAFEDGFCFVGAAFLHEPGRISIKI